MFCLSELVRGLGGPLTQCESPWAGEGVVAKAAWSANHPLLSPSAQPAALGPICLT